MGVACALCIMFDTTSKTVSHRLKESRKLCERIPGFTCNETSSEEDEEEWREPVYQSPRETLWDEAIAIGECSQNKDFVIMHRTRGSQPVRSR